MKETKGVSRLAYRPEREREQEDKKWEFKIQQQADNTRRRRLTFSASPWGPVMKPAAALAATTAGEARYAWALRDPMRPLKLLSMVTISFIFTFFLLLIFFSLFFVTLDFWGSGKEVEQVKVSECVRERQRMCVCVPTHVSTLRHCTNMM